VQPDTQIEYFLRIASRVGTRASLTVAVSDRDGNTLVRGDAEVLLPKAEV
jgi:hypothetical protein